MKLPTDPLSLARLSLETIRGMRRADVYAARPGICGGAILPDRRVFVFRRKEGRVRLEIWRSDGGVPVAYQDLPPELEHEAGEVLDGL